MDPALGLLLEISLWTGAVALFVHLAVRAVRYAKKRGSGASLVGTALLLFSFGGALNPAREVAAESRKLKRNQDGAGDPEDPDASDERE